MASTGAWMGSTVGDADIRKLRKGNFLGKEDEVGARAPDPEEILPNHEKGEVVVFNAHLERGLALPVSPFFVTALLLVPKNMSKIFTFCLHCIIASLIKIASHEIITK